jgi:hypothetical protein
MSNPSNRKFLALVIILLAWLGACTNQTALPVATATVPPTATSSLIIKPVAGIAATVTVAFKLPPLPPEQAAPYLEIRDMVLACD